jgi:hypothetical protein
MTIHPINEHTRFIQERDRWEASLQRQDDEHEATHTPAPTPDWAEVDRHIDARLGRIVEALEVFSEACVGQQERLEAALDR